MSSDTSPDVGYEVTGTHEGLGPEESADLSATRKSCFLICPIGAVDSDERKRADFTLRLLEEAMGDLYKISRADSSPLLGRLDHHVTRNLLSSDLLVVDLSSANPNVFFEFGIRFALLNKPYVCVCKSQELDHLPFDVSMLSVVPFPNDLPSYGSDYLQFDRDIEAAKERLREVIEGLSQERWPSPLADQAVSLQALAGASEKKGAGTLQILLDRLDELEHAVSRPRSRSSASDEGSSLKRSEEITDWLRRLIYLVQKQQFSEGVELGTRLLTERGEQPTLLYWTALAFMGEGNTDEARRLLKRTLEIEPDHAGTRVLLDRLGGS